MYKRQETDYIKKLLDLHATLNTTAKSRLITYIECVQSSINMHNINRDGGSVYYAVSIEDTAVYEFLCGVAVIAPCAIEPAGRGFTIKNGPIFSVLCDAIRSVLQPRTSRSAWPNVRSDGRVLFQHQADAVKTLIASPKTKQIIDITAGLGKTLIVIRYFLHLIATNTMPKYVIVSLPPSALIGVRDEFMLSNFKVNVLNMNVTHTNDSILPGVINFVYHDHMSSGSFNATAGRISGDLFFVVDELHKCLANDTLRTSTAISIAKTSARFIGLTGTLIINPKIKQVIEWLKLVTRFEVNTTNYFAALGMLISSRITTNIQVVRKLAHIDLTPEEWKRHNKSFADAVSVCYKIVETELVGMAIEYINKGTPVFIVAKDSSAQKYIVSQLKDAGVRRIHAITKDEPIDYKPGDPRRLQAIVTTPSQSTGYTITGMSTMLTSVYFGNQATRDQLDARLNRIGQPKSSITIVTVHCGLLSYVLEKYDQVKSLAEALKSFSELVTDTMPINSL